MEDAGLIVSRELENRSEPIESIFFDQIANELNRPTDWALDRGGLAKPIVVTMVLLTKDGLILTAIDIAAVDVALARSRLLVLSDSDSRERMLPENDR